MSDKSEKDVKLQEHAWVWVSYARLERRSERKNLQNLWGERHGPARTNEHIKSSVGDITFESVLPEVEGAQTEILCFGKGINEYFHLNNPVYTAQKMEIYARMLFTKSGCNKLFPFAPFILAARRHRFLSTPYSAFTHYTTWLHIYVFTMLSAEITIIFENNFLQFRSLSVLWFFAPGLCWEIVHDNRLQRMNF